MWTIWTIWEQIDCLFSLKRCALNVENQMTKSRRNYFKKKRTKQKQNSQSEQNFQVLTTILDIIYDAVTRWNV